MDSLLNLDKRRSGRPRGNYLLTGELYEQTKLAIGEHQKTRLDELIFTLESMVITFNKLRIAMVKADNDNLINIDRAIMLLEDMKLNK